MDGTAFGDKLEFPYMDAAPSEEMHNSSEELTTEETETDESEDLDPEQLLTILAFLSNITNRDNNDSVPRTVGNFTNEVDEFMAGMRQYKNNEGTELTVDMEEAVRQIISAWNSFLQPEQGVRGTSAIISSDIYKDINKLILWLEVQGGAQCLTGVKGSIKQWLQQWNIFLQAQAGEMLVTRVNLFLTIVGFIFYMLDLGSDIGAAIFFASNGQWWQAIVTVAIVYGAVIIHTALKWIRGQIHCTGAANRLCYVASLLVNWPDLEQYWALCLLEWQLHKSPAKNARLVLEWHQRRVDVAILKFLEGVWEACPQAILQLYLLVPDMYGAWTWTDYLRIAGACVSLCTAGAALVNLQKFNRSSTSTDLPLSELVVLYVWAVPVTVSRLLSLALLLSEHPYWVLVGVALHLVQGGVYSCRTAGVPRELSVVIAMCLESLHFCLSPFNVYYSIKYRRVAHAIHFLVNAVATVVWALGTPLVCAHPVLYTAIICVNAVMFVVGLVGWQLHEKHWPDSYRKYNN